MKARFFVATGLLGFVQCSAPPGHAGELAVKAPVAAIYSWTGFYLGGHIGYGGGNFGAGTNPILSQALVVPPTPTGFIGGFQAGYNVQLANRLVLGIETDLSFISPVDRPATGIAPFNTTFDYFGTARTRVGYAFGPVLPYFTGGAAWGQTHVSINDDSGNALVRTVGRHLGWTAGAGIELAVGGPWSARAEYSYIELPRATFDLGAANLPAVNVDPRIHLFKLGLNYRLWEAASGPASSAVPAQTASLSPSNDWNVHGQTTFIAQGYPRIRSPYEGANSLPGGGQGRETSTADAFFGWRLWKGGELYFNPELAQGFGLNSTLGLAGFPNGEAQKGGTAYPKFRPQRWYIRQTFGLGGEQEEVADGPLQLAGKRDVDRITVTVGRFAIGDFFDGNSYAKDPRADFMNWSIWSSGAYDFPADLPGFTRGAVVELNRKDWAVRAGFFQVPEQPNSDVLVFRGGAGGIAEFEQRYFVFDQPGKLRVGAFANRGNTANYRDAINIAASDPSLDINSDVVGNIRRNRLKYGFYANIEQALTEDVGVFARASWNDGRTEILSFTDIDQSVSAGVSIKGRAWGRPDDTVGLAGAVNGLSAAHRDFLAAGGIGLLIGDGQLTYRPEKILEGYYAWRTSPWSSLTFDYQFVANPAHNADRGPVSIFAIRAHAEF